METNKEHWAKEIIEIALGGDSLSLFNHKPSTCDNEHCEKCELHGCGDGCNYARLNEWANAEYKEPLQLTESEIEELNYYKHHGGTEIAYCNDDMAWVISDGNDKMITTYGLMCRYKQLDKTREYKIKDLLEGEH